MSNHPEIPMEESDNRQQEQREEEMWLDEREKETVRKIEEYMDQMFEYFFGGQHENK